MRGRPTDTHAHNSPLQSPTDPSGASILHASTNSSILHSSMSALKIGPTSAPHATKLLASSSSTGPLALIEKIREPLAFVLQPPEEQDDNWDDDFEEGISFTKLQGTLLVDYIGDMLKESGFILQHWIKQQSKTRNRRLRITDRQYVRLEVPLDPAPYHYQLNQR